MRKVILSLGILLLSASVTMAQHKKHKHDKDADKTTNVETQPQVIKTTAAPANVTLAKPAVTMKPEDMAFTDVIHDFGTVPEGPDATCEFTFVNKGTEPIVIQKAQPSCGCTVPSFSNQPVAPGATGTINVAYHTNGKPTGFTKTISVVSNAGTKVLTIRGTVEKAPTTSVPQTTSLIKTN